ncbi:MAG: nucleotidyltransferase substrate binding protein [Phormidesmis sp.]
MPPDTRWIQRYSNFERTFLLLSEAMRVENPSVLERAGLIQFFEMAFELSWKILKDYEQAEGIKAKSPREVIKQAYQIGLINEGHEWINALQDRNLTAHTYKEEIARTVEQRIRESYYPLIKSLYEIFKAKKEAAEKEDMV